MSSYNGSLCCIQTSTACLPILRGNVCAVNRQMTYEILILKPVFLELLATLTISSPWQTVHQKPLCWVSDSCGEEGLEVMLKFVVGT